jgi:hypothetical protein
VLVTSTVLVTGGVSDWLVANNAGSRWRLLDLGGDIFERERTCDGRDNVPGVAGNDGDKSSWKEKVA